MIKAKKTSSIYAVGAKNHRGSRKVLTEKQISWAYTKWCEGYNLVQIAEALNVCEKTISRAINGRPRIRPVLRYQED